MPIRCRKTTLITVTATPKTSASRFVRIDNQTIQNPALSFRARGILAYILSRPKHWKHSADSLADATNEGADSLRTALNELKEAGYASLDRVREKGGRVSNRWSFRESPRTEKPDPVRLSPDREKPHPAPNEEKPEAGEPGPGRPRCGQPGDGKMAPYETTGSETTVIETTDVETTGERNQPLPSFVPLSISLKDAADLRGEFRLSEPALRRLLEDFNAERKKWFHQDGPTDLPAFRAWLRTPHARDIATRVNRLDAPGASHATELEEPEGWREFITKHSPESVYAPGKVQGTKPWAELDRATKEWITQQMRN